MDGGATGSEHVGQATSAEAGKSEEGGGGIKGLRETVKTMGRLVLADSRELQDVAEVVFKRFEVNEGRLSEMHEAIGEAYNAQSKVLRDEVQAGEQVDSEACGPPCVAVFAASVKRWGTEGNLANAEITKGFADPWKDVIMTSTPGKLTALVPYFRWKPNKGKPDNDKDKKDKGDKGDKGKVKDTGKGQIMYAVDLSYVHGHNAIREMNGVYKARAAPPGPLLRALSQMIHDM
ncbi:unnamed protein product [Prorocentrum cordatum]|uniref:Uncharacterized protein n=1 Tax=Prorocentrum cordatum TaxID=2364126 RepID=A0ABN9UZU5_9DINO|nr:unnamed protein product [Polarella glacialis]